MPDSLEQLLGQVQSYKAGSDKATQQVLAALGTQAQISSDISSIYSQQATDDTTVIAAKQAAEFKTQLARVQAANLVGANLNSSTEVLSNLSAAATDAQKRKDEALAAIQEKNNVGLFDNPLQYIVNQFTVNDDIAKHNIANQQLESTHNRIMEVNAEAQQSAQTQNMISEPLTAASMEAATRSAAVAANVNAKTAQIQGLGYNTRGIEFALNSKKEVLSLAFQGNNAVLAEKQYQRSLEALELQKKEFEWRQKEYNDKQNDREEQQALAQSVVDTINLGRKALLGPNSTPLDDVSGKMAIAALKGKGTLSSELQKYYDAGERTRLMGSVVVGSTPAAAAETMQTVPVQLNPTQLPIKNILSQASVDTSNALKNAEVPGQNKDPVFAGLDKKDKNSIAAAYNGRAQQILNSFARVVKPGDSSNPYQIGSVNQLAEHSPTIQALPVYKKVLEPLIKQGVILQDPKQIMSLVGDAVAKGSISHAQALELTTVYHVGVTANLAMRNFKGFGLIPSLSYNAEVLTDPTAWHTNEVIDMTKPDAISRALMKLQAGRMRQQMLTGNGTNSVSMPDINIPTHFGPKTNYPATPEGQKQADEAYSKGWDQPVTLDTFGVRRSSYGN